MSRLSDAEIEALQRRVDSCPRDYDNANFTAKSARALLEEVRASRSSPGERERALEEALRAVVGEPDGADDVFTLSRACNRILALASPSRTDGDHAAPETSDVRR